MAGLAGLYDYVLLNTCFYSALTVVSSNPVHSIMEARSMPFFFILAATRSNFALPFAKPSAKPSALPFASPSAKPFRIALL